MMWDSHFCCAALSIPSVLTCWNNRLGQVEFSMTRRKVASCTRLAALAPSAAVNDKLAAVSTGVKYNRAGTVTQCVRQDDNMAVSYVAGRQFIAAPQNTDNGFKASVGGKAGKDGPVQNEDREAVTCLHHCRVHPQLHYSPLLLLTFVCFCTQSCTIDARRSLKKTQLSFKQRLKDSYYMQNWS